MKKLGVIVLSIITSVLLIVLLLVVGFGLKLFSVNSDRYVFKHSVTYTEEEAQFLSKSYKEYNETNSKEEKKAIKEYVIMRYPNISIDSIENMKLRNFYNECQGQE